MALLPVPATPKLGVTDNLHGRAVPDPYRWLEDAYSAETEAWVRAQNARSRSFLDGLPQREEITKQLTELWDFPRADPPFRRGQRWFQWRNPGLANQAVLYRMGSASDEGTPLLDPNPLSADGTVSVAGAAVSKDGSLLAYAISEAGSDQMTWRVRDVETGQDRPDTVRWAVFSTAAWLPDGSGFYYSSAGEVASVLSSKTGRISVYLHLLGTGQDEDRLVFVPEGEQEAEPWATVSDDGRYLVVTIERGAGQMRAEITDLERPGDGPTVVVPDFSCLAEYVTNVGATFYFLTDHQAERRRLVAVDLNRPGQEHWHDVIPEQEDVLVFAAEMGHKLVCHYLGHACARLKAHDLDGTLAHEVPLPPASAIGEQVRGGPGLAGRPEDDVLFFGTQSFTSPGAIWSHDLSSGATALARPPALDDEDELVTDLVFVDALDGARVPLFLTHRRDLGRDGRAPALLYGYGGFGIAITPWFSPAHYLFAKRGGVLAVACLRGGSEYGRPWHDQGRLHHKQNVFDDFCQCARWLAAEGWSSPARTGITGRSNGGLLVGACLTQHPELFGAAVPEVGVMDMLRFHKFTVGGFWKSDYGDPEAAEDFNYLIGYSPLHNIKPGTSYPPTLVTTGDHDDRVVPGHSFKFAAALQEAQADPEAPVLIRVETSTGHGAGKPTAKAIAERADVLAFLEWALGSG